MTRDQLTKLANPNGDRVDFEADMRAGICSFCRERVTSRNPNHSSFGFIEFYTERRGQLFYPSNDQYGGSPVALFSHARCGPDGGYWLALDQIENIDCQYGLVDHISTKIWCCEVYIQGLRLAYAFIKKKGGGR